MTALEEVSFGKRLRSPAYSLSLHPMAVGEILELAVAVPDAGLAVLPKVVQEELDDVPPEPAQLRAEVRTSSPPRQGTRRRPQGFSCRDLNDADTACSLDSKLG
jgi:hypothetical protein